MLDVRNGGLLLGGFNPSDQFTPLCLKSFWHAWAKFRPGHALYDLHGHRLHRVIPFALHLDEGRGLRKSAVLAVHAQGVFGAETRRNFNQELHFRMHEGALGENDMQDMMLRNQFHNARGSTYLSRMLYTLLPKASYTKGNSAVFDAVMDKLREECTALLEDGFLTAGGLRWYACLVAVKGDAPALVKAGHFTRNFQCIGNPICFECMAGRPGTAFEDCRRNPTYEATLYTTRPWDTPSPLAQVPGVPTAPEMVFQRDPFHVYKQSIGGSFVASAIVLLAELGYWDSNANSFPDIMDRMYADFAHYVKHEWSGRAVPFIKHFTRTNLHYPRASAFPYARPKGGDVMLLTRWLRHAVLHGPLRAGVRSGNMVQRPLQPWHGPVLRCIADAASGALSFLVYSIIRGYGLVEMLPRSWGKEPSPFAATIPSLPRSATIKDWRDFLWSHPFIITITFGLM